MKMDSIFERLTSRSFIDDFSMMEYLHDKFGYNYSKIETVESADSNEYSVKVYAIVEGGEYVDNGHLPNIYGYIVDFYDKGNGSHSYSVKF